MGTTRCSQLRIVYRSPGRGQIPFATSFCKLIFRWIYPRRLRTVNAVVTENAI